MNYIILFSGTAGIILFSWLLSVKHARFHGVARFFSFESIFLLTYLNIHYWFLNPFSLQQIVSFLLLILAAYIAIAGFITLKIKGRPSGGNFENTTVLVENGLYKIIRHPLYLSLFLLGTGIALKNITALTALLGILNLVAVWQTSKIEEEEMKARFGEVYSSYMKRTKMFIPFIL
jgi:protein-S-isoprenylcysteine O-methyltransferase Ste14